MALVGRLLRDVRLVTYQNQIIRLASNKVHFRQINSNIQLLNKESDPEHKRPLVLLYAWLAAKGRHKKKYADFYLNKGFDVLHVSIKPSQLLLPTNAQSISQTLLDLLLEDENLSGRDIAVHAFSVGAYLYAEALVKFSQYPESYGEIAKRVRGHIYDSPVGRRGISEGFPKALTKNKTVVKLSSNLITWYLETFNDSITRHYDLAEQTALANPYAIPALFLYSEADPVGQARIIESYVARMRQNENAEISSHCWEKSPHVSHMLHHPQEYLSLVNKFLEEIGIGNTTVSRGDEVVDRSEMKG